MRVLLVVLLGLAAAALTFRIGWDLPRAETCSGDTCESTSWFAIDWDRVTWQVKPSRIACFQADPARSSVLIHPGDVCVRARGDRVESRRTYDQLRSDIARRRAVTLVVIAAIAAGAGSTAWRSLDVPPSRPRRAKRWSATCARSTA